jgi:energy-coupling factor transport system permease protein
MVNKDTFSGFHPLVNFLYFGLTLTFSMIFMHPACLALVARVRPDVRRLFKRRKAARFRSCHAADVSSAALLNPRLQS